VVELMRWSGLIGLALLTHAAPTLAHAFLERASPLVGSEIAASPPEIAITFTEGVEPFFSAIEVRGPNGTTVSAGTPQVAPDNNRVLSIQLPKLPPGIYTVIWHVTSVDTHKTEGNFQFTVTH
jgi:copper resistance protein C